MSRQAAGKLRWALFPLLFYCLPLSLAAYSYVRIVRLSFVEGEVRVMRPNSAGPARGLANLPLEHNAVVETTNGVAEIEFEEEAFVRLAPGSHLHLAELGLLDNGERVTRLFLAQGTATFDADLPRGDSFLVLTPQFQVTVAKQAVFRVDFSPDSSRVRVFQGDVRVEAQASTLRVVAGQMLEWRADSGEMLLTRNPEPDAWDQWNQERRQIARALLNYQAPLSGGLSTTPWYTHSYYSYYPYYSSCSGWHYDPFAGWWSWGPGGFIDPFFGWAPSYWYAGGYPGCTTPWYWQYGWGVIPRGPVPADPPAPPETDAGPEGSGRPRIDPDRNRPERGPRPRRSGWEDLLELRQTDLERARPGRDRLPGTSPTPGESLPTVEGTQAGGSPAVRERPRSAPPRQPGVERPGAVRPLARPDTSSPGSRISSRPSRTPAARPPAARSGQVRSSPSRSTPPTSRPASRPSRPPKP